MADAPTEKPSPKWRKGQSGNPAGKPKGTRNLAAVALDAIGTDSAKAVLEKVVEAAKTGDLRAAEILLARVWPVRKGRLVDIPDLPQITAAADLPTAIGAVLRAMSTGILTPEEAASVAAVFDLHRRAVETVEHERRIEALEAAVAAER